MSDDLDPFEASLRAGLERLRAAPDFATTDHQLGTVVRLGRRRRVRNRVAGGIALAAALMVMVLLSTLGGAERADPERVLLGGSVMTSSSTRAVQELVDRAEEDSTTTVPVEAETETASGGQPTIPTPPTSSGPGPGPVVGPGVGPASPDASSGRPAETTTTTLPPPLPCLEVDYRASDIIGMVHPGPRDAYGRIRSVCMRLRHDQEFRASSLPLTDGPVTQWQVLDDGQRRMLVTIPGPYTWALDDPDRPISYPTQGTFEMAVTADVDDITREGYPLRLIVD